MENHDKTVLEEKILLPLFFFFVTYALEGQYATTEAVTPPI